MSKGHEPWLYETPEVIAGLFLIFTIVEMKGPNKQLNRKHLGSSGYVEGYTNLKILIQILQLWTIILLVCYQESTIIRHCLDARKAFDSVSN